ncbi:MAG: response regulator [Terriglobia bacterium]
MQETIRALLVQDGEPCFQALESILEKQGIVIREAPGCAEALALIGQLDSPHLVFTDTRLPDGTWADVLNLVSGVQPRNSVKVIVVSRVVDHRLYLDAIESGAFDFIAPPFEPDDVAFIVRSAILSAWERRTRTDAPSSRPAQRQRSAGVGNSPKSQGA